MFEKVTSGLGKWLSWTAVGALVCAAVWLITPAEKVFGWILNGFNAYSSIDRRIELTEKLIQTHSLLIESNSYGIRDFKSVWCIDRLSSQPTAHPRIIEACAKWIANP